MKTSHCEIHKSKDKDGKEVTKMKVVKEPHLRVQVEWKNREISWVAADAMKEQNPFVFLPYVMKRKLSDHPHSKWIMKYGKNKENVTNLFKVYATRMKKSTKVPKFKFGI